MFRSYGGDRLAGYKPEVKLNVLGSFNPDPHWDKVVLYLRGQGENNSTNIIDSSPNPKSIIRNGNPIISTTQSVKGNSSIFFNGSSFLQIASNFDFNFTGDFTLETYIYLMTYAPATVVGSQLFGTVNGSASGYSWNLGQSANNLRLIGSIGGSWRDIAQGGNNAGPDLNSWTHLALSRNNNTLRFFKNGALISSHAFSTNFPESTIIIGSFNDSFNLRFLNGFLSFLRVTKDVGRYTAPFNPETDTFLAY